MNSHSHSSRSCLVTISKSVGRAWANGSIAALMVSLLRLRLLLLLEPHRASKLGSLRLTTWCCPCLLTKHRYFYILASSSLFDRGVRPTQRVRGRMQTRTHRWFQDLSCSARLPAFWGPGPFSQADLGCFGARDIKVNEVWPEITPAIQPGR